MYSKMNASLTSLPTLLAKPSSLLILLATVTVMFGLASCGNDVGNEDVQDAPDQTATASSETITATVPLEPTPTETPYWAKRILPQAAMEQYPPLNTRTDYELRNNQEWLNGGPTTIASLRGSGEIVLVDFWTYT